VSVKTFGTMGVDWEDRVDYARLRQERLGRIKASLAASELGALLLFDMANIRYVAAAHIGTWAMDKYSRFTLLPRGDDPIVWDLGSAAKHHELYCSWLKGRSHSGITTFHGAIAPEAGRPQDVARKIKAELEARGLADAPVGVDVGEIPIVLALEAEGLHVVDGHELMLQTRRIKTADELVLLNTSAAMVDAAYEELYRALRPGIQENECVGLVSRYLYDRGSEFVEAVNAITGDRSNPHPHVHSDRLIRPGEAAYFDIIHSFNGYRTCYYRTFAVGSASPGFLDAYKRTRDILDCAISMVKPGVTTAEIVGHCYPKAEEFGYPDEEAAFGLQFGHGIGLSHWEKPVFSRLTSFAKPEVLEPGMAIALETFWPSSDGRSAARIEEELIVTADGCEVISRFPAETLLVAGRQYFSAAGPLPQTRDAQSHRNNRSESLLD